MVSLFLTPGGNRSQASSACLKAPKERMFEGSLAGIVSHLLATREVSREELNQLERLIAERKKRK